MARSSSIVLLTPLQSVTIHGWLYPKRTLSWDDIVANDSITVKKLAVDANISQESLKLIQPDIYEWIHKKYVSYDDVPYMTGFPLNPITHLNGDISTLVQHRYSPQVLSAVGLDYGKLQMNHLNVRWMKMLNFTLREWMTLGMTVQDVASLSNSDIAEVFGAKKEAILMGMGMAESFRNPT